MQCAFSFLPGSILFFSEPPYSYLFVISFSFLFSSLLFLAFFLSSFIRSGPRQHDAREATRVHLDVRLALWERLRQLRRLRGRRLARLLVLFYGFLHLLWPWRGRRCIGNEEEEEEAFIVVLVVLVLVVQKHVE